MALLYDLIDPAELVGFVRELEFDDLTVFDSVLPPTQVDNIEYEVMKDSRDDVDAAEYRSFDAEAGIGKRQGIQKLRGQIPPVSRKIRLGEEERLRNEAQRTGDTSRLIESIFDDAAKMARSVRARITLAQGEALTTGAVALSENGVEATASYGVPGGHLVTAGASWATASTSIVADLRTWQNTYMTTNKGLRPGGMFITSDILGYLQLNDEFRSLLASLSGAPALITRDAVDQVISAFGLPPILGVVDTQVRVAGVATRIIPADHLIMVPPASAPLGNTPWGVTAEALELREGGMISDTDLSGMVATAAKTEFDPVATWTKAAALSIPVLANPDRLFVADVVP